MTSPAIAAAMKPLERPLLGVVLLLACFSWLSPNHYQPWSSFHGQWSAAAAAALLGAFAWTDPRAGADRWPWLALVAGATALVPWLQFAGGVISFLGDALLPSLYLLAFALSQVLGGRLVRMYGLQRLVEVMSGLVVVAALATLWIALHDVLGMTYLYVYSMGLDPGARPHGNFGQPNHMALALVLGTAGVVALWRLRRIGVGVAVALIACFSLGVAMTQSRAGMLLLVGALGWLALCLWRQQGPRAAGLWLAWAGGAAIAGFLAWDQFLVWRSALDAAGNDRPISEMLQPGWRPTHWLTLLDASLRSPWVGYGWNQVGAAQYLVAPDHPTTNEMLADAHNLVIDLLVQNGVVLGALLALCLAAWVLDYARRSAQNPLAALAMTPVLVFFAHSMVEFPLNYLYFLLPAGLLMGALAESLTPTRSVRAPRTNAALILAATVALAVPITREYLHAEEDLLGLRLQENRVGTPQPRTMAKEAHLLTQLAAFLLYADMPRGREDLSEEELAWIGKTALRYPNWSLLGLYAAELARNARPQEATQVLQRICKTQKVTECSMARQRWTALSTLSPKIAAVPFPASP